MKILLDIPDNKAHSLMHVLKSIAYVSVNPLTDAEVLLLEENKEAIDEMQLIKAREKEGRDAEVFLNEL